MGIDLADKYIVLLETLEHFLNNRLAFVLLLHRTEGIGKVGFRKPCFLGCAFSHTDPLYEGLFGLSQILELPQPLLVIIVVGIGKQINFVVARDERIREPRG